MNLLNSLTGNPIALPLESIQVSPLAIGQSIPQSSSLLFVDTLVSDYQQIIATVSSGTEVHILDSTQDAIGQITATLLGRTGITSLQILSHGQVGSLDFAHSALSLDNVMRYESQLQSWQQALTVSADILLYGCNVAQNSLGETFINFLAQTTGADVAASNDFTGNSALGGNWNLEVQTGGIETVALGGDRLANYQSILATLTKVVPSGNPYPDAAVLTDVNGTLYFVANTGNFKQLWKSDGTAAGTVMVKGAFPSGFDSGMTSLTNVNGTVYFTSWDSANQNELWKSDGTAAGTVMVKNINRGGSSGAYNLTNVNGTLFFIANDGVNGERIWKSDGTEAGTVMIKDPNSYRQPSSLTNFNGSLYFSAYDPNHGIELWKSDGTESGTFLLKDIEPRAATIYGSGDPRNFTPVNGTLYFSASDNNLHGRELWKTDGTEAGTMLVKDISSSDSDPSQMTNVNGTLYFRAYDSTHGYELWKSDGTEAGTVLVKDIYPGNRDSQLSNLTNVNGTLYFTADGGVNVTELWKSDGTAAGTVVVKNINPSGNASYPANLINVNDTLYFTADDGTHGQEVWQSDGTANGTVLVQDINVGAPDSRSTQLTNVNGTLYLVAYDNRDIAIWKTNNRKTAPQADLLLRNNASGDVAIWGLDNTQIAAGDYAQLADGTVIRPDANWKLISGKSDFNNDGVRDLVWFNTASTETAIWYMQLGAKGLANVIGRNSLVYAPGANQAITPSGGWQLAAVTDLLGDSRPEFLWEDRTTGLSAIWQLDIAANGRADVNLATSNLITTNNSARTPVSSGGMTAGWKMIGVGNFDGDLTTRDLLWFNEKTTETAIWQLNGTVLAGGEFIQNNGLKLVPGLGWRPVSIGNIDGTGTDEIIWQNGTTVATWALNPNFTITAKSGVLSQSLAIGEQIQGLADFDRNGTLDLVVRRKSGGADTTQIYYLNASNFQLSSPTPSRYITLPGQTSPITTGDARWDVADVADLGGPLA